MNHAVHSGLLGRNIAAAAITGRTRHLFGPDAYALMLTGDLFLGTSVSGEGGVLVVQRGEIGIHEIMDGGAGLGLACGLGIEATDLYYNGPVDKVTANQFLGPRFELAASGAFGGLSVGGVLLFAPLEGNTWVIGIGSTIGVDAIPVRVGGGATYGETTRWDVRRLFRP